LFVPLIVRPHASIDFVFLVCLDRCSADFGSE
jgi:hypothetical protein